MNKKDIIFWIIIVCFISLCIYVIFWTKTETAKCAIDPYRYVMDLFEKANKAEVSCVCTSHGPNSAPGSVYWTKEGFTRIP